MKKLNWYDVRETERIKIKAEDLEIVNRYIDDEIELSYDENTYKVYAENGDYIADIVEILED